MERIQLLDMVSGKMNIFFGILIIFLFVPFVLAINATYNSTFSAPYCGDSSESPCVASSDLLKSRDSITGTAEPNQPNTIDSCADGSDGTYQSDESAENITITDLNNSNFETGDRVQVNFSIFCYSTPSDDRYAVYYTNVTSSPAWKRVTSGNPTCSSAGFNSYSESFSLDEIEGYHAVRVIIEYGENIASACPTSSGYADKDDLVFKVASSVGESVNPNVTDLRPVSSVEYNVTNTIEIGANVTSNGTDMVFVNISLPNGSVSQLILSNTSNWYNISYTIPNVSGRYNVTFVANDSSNNVNDTEKIYFIGRPFFSTLILNSSSETNLSSENLTSYLVGLAPSDSKIVYDWRMNASSFAVLNMFFENNSAFDYSIFANNGVVNGATFNLTGGYDGKGAYEFDGSNDEINISYSSSLVNNYTNEMTIMAWVKPLSYEGYKEAVRKERSYHLANTGSNWDLGFKDTSNTNKGVTVDNSAVPLTQWTHLVLTTNGTHVFAYVNGELNQSTNVSAFTIGNNVNNSLYLGNYGTSDEGGTLGRYFNGTIDDVMIFNRSLSGEQIRAIYDNRTDLIVSQETSVGEVWNVCGTPTDSGVDGSEVCSNNLTIIVSGEVCSPTINEDWWISGEEICDGVIFDLGLGDIVLSNGGVLNLIGNSNFSAKSLEINRTGDAVFIERGSRLILG